MKFTRAKRYKGGALGDITRRINEIQKSLESLRAILPIRFQNENNSLAIGYDGSGAGGGGYVYRSYFRLVAVDEATVGITAGSSTYSGSGYCGAVKINGDLIWVDVSSQSVSAEGYVWLHSWIDAEDGASAEIIFGTSTPPDNPNGGLAYASQLVGRWEWDEENGRLGVLTQDYLRGGEHTEFLWGDCDGEEIE